MWLEAVALEPREDHTIRLELDWKTTPALEKDYDAVWRDFPKATLAK